MRRLTRGGQRGLGAAAQYVDNTQSMQKCKPLAAHVLKVGQQFPQE